MSRRQLSVLAASLVTGLGCGGATDVDATPPVCAELPPPPGTLKIVAGWEHTCVLRSGEALICWGRDDLADRLAAVVESLPSPAVDVDTVSFDHSPTICVLEASGVATCVRVPERLPPSWPRSEADVRTVSTNGGFACSMREDRSGTCWWGSAAPTITDGFGTISNNPWRWDFSSGPLWALAAGSSAICGLDADCRRHCWGPEWTDLSDERFRSLDNGERTACGIRLDGSLDCWGVVHYNDGTVGPAPAPPAGSYEQVSVSRNFACAVGSDHQLDCWGVSFNADPVAPAPPPPPPPGRYVQVAVGLAHACALREDDTVVCWADNLDDGSAGVLDVPAELR